MDNHDDVVQELPRLTLPKRTRSAPDPEGPRAIDLRLRRNESPGNPGDPIPERVLLIRPVPGDPSCDQLYLDHVPLPRDAWRFDERDRILSWRGAYGGGHLYLTHRDLGATGNIGAALAPVAVTAGATASFLCDVALDTGATYLTSGDKIVGFQWDPTSSAWNAAPWVPNRLLLSYTVTPGGPFEPPTFSFEFNDEQTQSIPWDPVQGLFTATLALGTQSGQMVWDLTFFSSIAPDPDLGIDPSTGPDTVSPSGCRRWKTPPPRRSTASCRSTTPRPAAGWPACRASAPWRWRPVTSGRRRTPRRSRSSTAA